MIYLHCCTGETSTTLSSNYPPIKKKENSIKTTPGSLKTINEIDKTPTSLTRGKQR